MPPRSLTHRAAHATWWSALEIASRYGVQFSVTVVLARLLTPSDFGLIAMLVVFTAVAALLVDSGFATALVQKQATSNNDETTVFVFSTGVSAAVAIALWFAAPAIASFYSQPLLTPLTRLLLFALPLSALAAVPDALLTQRLDFKSRAKAEVVGSLCSGALAIVLAWRGFGVWSLAWQSIVSVGIRAILLWWYSKWRPRGRFSTNSFRQLFGFGGYMLLANLLSTIYTRLQSLLIGKLFDSRTLGYYTLAQSAQQAPASFISAILNRVGLPVFASVAKEKNKLVGALRLSLRVAVFLFVPCMVGIAVMAKPLIILVYGARWTPAAPLLTILAVGATFWPLHVLNLAAISAQGRSDLIFRIEVWKRVISIGLIVACSPGGPIAIAWAVLASSLFGVAINTWYTRKLLGYGAVAQLRDQAGTVALALPAAAIGWAVLHWTSPTVFSIIAAIIAAAIVYLGLAALSRYTPFMEIIELAHTLRANAAPPRDVPGR